MVIFSQFEAGSKILYFVLNHKPLLNFCFQNTNIYGIVSHLSAVFFFGFLRKAKKRQQIYLIDNA